MKKIICCSLFLFSTMSFSAGLMFGAPVYNGPGCPQGSLTYALSPNSNSLSILSNGSFALSATSSSGLKRTSCFLQIPLSVSNNTVVGADIRGFHDLPAQTSSRRNAEYSLDLGRSMNIEDHVAGPNTNTYEHRHQLNVTCNQTRFLRLLLSSLLATNEPGQTATYTLDSIDLAEVGAPAIALQLCSGAAGITTIFALASAVAGLFAL